MPLTEEFRQEIDSFLAESGMDPTTFGRKTMNDPRFVFDIRAGRASSSRTIEHVREWIKTQEGVATVKPKAAA